ncbi:hypothetical protein Glove_482g72 [Diversispora epigaea]|uniref:Uncharacterized protein n=1 Tax=Diversispora epigaea TaxID=1348612 RepID=A0A397GKW7_9GLOM|nr:hypothetical protein Glove_482g72 [Diversispora epigaea]
MNPPYHSSRISLDILLKHIKNSIILVFKINHKNKNRRKIMNLVDDITVVALGIRVSHLVDTIFLTIDETQQLIDEFHKNSELSHLFALQFSDTHTFICNKYLFITKLEELDLYLYNNDDDDDDDKGDDEDDKGVEDDDDKKVNDDDDDDGFNNLLFVNVSWKENGIPELMNPPSSFKELLKTLKSQVNSQVNSSPIDNNNNNNNNIKNPNSINSITYFPQTPSCIITFTGWILEYSMIYVIDYNYINSIENINSVEDMNYENFKNCLGNQDLKLVQVFLSSNKSNTKIQRHMLLSFSFPTNLKPRRRNGSGRRGKRIATISIELLSTKKLIDNLKSKFNDRLKNQDIWNKEIEIEISDVCLPIIAL